MGVSLVARFERSEIIAMRIMLWECARSRHIVASTPPAAQHHKLRGRFRPMFHPGITCSVVFFGSRQEMVFSLVRR
ncbi:hypothetical protein ACFVX6_30550, partial [Streptomyces sp. NPDC058289]|uniref:hypothetical protein n=1 Tax=Streptomyces sp. NPDC058289 TaxID=3346425 RepID=UPI0036EF3937